MTFIFDTGASDVSISSTEAEFLLKQGLLEETDIKGKIKYKIANGKIEEGTKIIIREINIDGIILKNVKASIVHQADAPLLLGQSAISKLGSIKLDGNKLIINPDKAGSFKFLDINLTKNIYDFGFSLENLSDEKDFTPATFKTLKIKKNHFLEEFEFNDQNVIFNKEGNIVAILLVKYTPENVSNKYAYSKKFYNLILEKLNSKYWITDNQKENKSLWESKNMQLSLNFDNGKQIRLTYIPKGLIVSSLKTTNKSSEEKTEQERKITLEILNLILNNRTNKMITRNFARFIDNNLEIHTDVKVDFIVKNKDSQYIMERLSFNILNMLVTSNEEKVILLKSDFEYLVFKIQIKDENYERKYKEGKISKRNFQNMNVPFSEKEIIDILEQ